MYKGHNGSAVVHLATDRPEALHEASIASLRSLHCRQQKCIRPSKLLKLLRTHQWAAASHQRQLCMDYAARSLF